MGRLERFLLGSVSLEVAARAHCSVEVVREKRVWSARGVTSVKNGLEAHEQAENISLLQARNPPTLQYRVLAPIKQMSDVS